MHQSNQPQTTSNSLIRDAAVQIDAGSNGGENHCINNDLFHVKPAKNDKTEMLVEGVMRKFGGTREGRINQPGPCADAVAELAWLVSWLTSENHSVQEAAKKEVRKLVKLGEGDCK